MEEKINKIVNFAIGAVKSLGEGAEVALKNLEKEFNQMIAKGGSSTDENSVKVKIAVNDAVTRITGIVNSAITNLNEATGQAQKVVGVAIGKAKEGAASISGSKTSKKA